MGRQFRNAKDRFTQKLNEIITANPSRNKYLESDDFTNDLYDFCSSLADYNLSTQKYAEGEIIRFSIKEDDIEFFVEKIKELANRYHLENKELLDIIKSVHMLAKDWNEKRKHRVISEDGPLKAFFNLDELPDEFWTAIREQL